MKKLIALLMVLVVLSTCLCTFASSNIIIDGQSVSIPEGMGEVFSKDDITYVPVRFILEYFGYDVLYSVPEKQVMGTDSKGNLFMMQLGNPLLFHKGSDMNEIKKVAMDVVPFADYSIGRTYIPAVSLFDELGYSLELDEGANTVIVFKKAVAE